MVRFFCFLLSCCLLFSPVMALAQSVATVEAMQMPVLLERNDIKQPLSPGMELQSGDRLLTGKSSRVLLQMAEGSHVKLGENVEFELQSPGGNLRNNETFKAVMNVVKGAFRFTTGILNKYRRRDITANISTVTIGIRGTDVWGKAEPDRDFVVLLEGSITIQREGEAEQTMSDAMSLFMAPKGQPALPIAPVDPDDLARWAQETELQQQEGVMNSEGRYVLHLASYEDATLAEVTLARLEKAGYAAEITGVDVAGRAWTRLYIEGFTTIVDAEAAGQSLSALYGFTSPWIDTR